MEKCVFCKIVRGEIPCYKIDEDNNALALLDIKPHTKGHTVVIPKNHGETVNDFSEKELQELIVTIKRTMNNLQKVLQPDGFNVGWNHLSVAGQVVPHLHVHIMPRYNGDGGGSMHSIIKNPGNESVEEVAKKFR